MPETRERVIEHWRASRRTLLAAIDGLGDEAMSEPSIDGWSVKDHLLHIALWDEIRASEIDRVSAGHRPAWPPVDEAQHDALGRVLYELRRDLGVEQARWELQTSRERLYAALAAASQAGLEPSRYGEAGLVSQHEVQHAAWIAAWRRRTGA